MEHKIIWRGLNPTDYDKKYLEDKIAKIEKILAHLKTSDKIWVEAEIDHSHRDSSSTKLIIDISLKGAPLRAVGEASGLQTAIDAGMEEMTTLLKKYKDKNINKKRQAGRKMKTKLRNKNI